MVKQKKKLKEAKEAHGKRTTISSIVYDMLSAGKADEVIIKTIKKKFPESKISVSHLSWYRRQLKINQAEKSKVAPAKETKNENDEASMAEEEMALNEEEDDGYEEEED